jgi:branched-chain amino acid transport system substrate-binding protein
MRRLSRLTLGALCAGALAVPALAEDGVTATEIVLGTHTALSGRASPWGIGSRDGTLMRIDEANEKGLHGRKIRLVIEDNQYPNVPRAVQAGNKLINNDNIFIMLGALGTPENNAVWALQEPKGVPNIFPFTAARSMHEPFHALKFALFSTYYDQVRAAVKHFLGQGKQKVCSMYQDTDFGHEIRDGVRDQVKAHNLAVVAEAAYGPLDTDFVAPITKLRSAGCDLVVMGSIIVDTIQSVGTARKLGWTDVTFVGQAASYDQIVAGAPGGITEGLYSGTGMPYAYADTSSDAVKAWSAKYKTRTGKDANAAAQYAYVGADIVIKALEAAGKDLTRAKFIAALESTKGYRPMFPGPALNYGAKQRQGANATFLARVEGGRWKVVAENLMY